MKAIYKESYSLPFENDNKELVNDVAYEICKIMGKRGMNTEIVRGTERITVSGAMNIEVDENK